MTDKTHDPNEETDESKTYTIYWRYEGVSHIEASSADEAEAMLYELDIEALFERSPELVVESVETDEEVTA